MRRELEGSLIIRLWSEQDEPKLRARLLEMVDPQSEAYVERLCSTPECVVEGVQEWLQRFLARLD